MPNIKGNLVFYLIIAMLTIAVLARNPIMLIPPSVRIILNTRRNVRIKGKEAFLASTRFKWSLLINFEKHHKVQE
jgi:hypothetical protein